MSGTPRCPKCGSRRVVGIVYGKPSHFGRLRAALKLVELGGCEPPEKAPAWRCHSCGQRWSG